MPLSICFYGMSYPESLQIFLNRARWQTLAGVAAWGDMAYATSFCRKITKLEW
jgi:hypothetical protein